jgi:tight adherence protein C
MTPLLSALCIFGSVLLFAYWRMQRTDPAGDRMRALTTREQADSPSSEPFMQRVIVPTFQSLLSRALDLLPTSLIEHVRRWLLISGSSIPLTTFLICVVGIGLTIPLAYLVVVFALTGGLPTGPLLFVLPVITILAFMFPIMTLRRRATERQYAILKALPECLDLLTTCVEAGLSLDYAFQRVADRQHGPLADEITRMLREKALGQTRRDALTAMAERIDLPDVNVFVQSVVQAESQGTSIAAVLRTQSRQLRIRRRQRAEVAAQQAGPKMVFPLVFFVLPSLFIVILGPVAIDVWGDLGGF